MGDASQSVSFASWTKTSICGVPISYSISVTPSTTLISLLGTSIQIGSPVSGQVGTYSVIISGSLNMNPIGVYGSASLPAFNVVIQLPCSSPTITPQSLSAIAYNVRGTAITSNLAAWSSDLPACGPISYSVSITPSISPSPISFTSGSSVSITVETIFAAAVGTYSVAVSASQTY